MDAAQVQKLLDTVVSNTLATLVKIDLSSTEAGALLTSLDTTLRMLENLRDLNAECRHHVREARRLHAELLRKRFAEGQITRH